MAKVLSGKMKLNSVDQMKRDWNNERQAMLSATGGVFVPRVSVIAVLNYITTS